MFLGLKDSTPVKISLVLYWFILSFLVKLLINKSKSSLLKSLMISKEKFLCKLSFFSFHVWSWEDTNKPFGFLRYNPFTNHIDSYNIAIENTKNALNKLKGVRIISHPTNL